jgi:hypothetical protein
MAMQASIKIHISELKTLCDRAGNFASEETENPETLCANWRNGCNGISDGPDAKGFLALCDECAARAACMEGI